MTQHAAAECQPTSETVPAYRFYLVDDTGRPLRVIDAACHDDRAARVVARESLTRYAAAADLWQGLRYMEKIARSPDDGPVSGTERT